MSLSCDCGTDYDGPWMYYVPKYYSILDTKRRRRCCSCRKLIDIGSIVVRFERWKRAANFVEESIYGEGYSVPAASWYMCEECGDLYFSLEELGFCVYINDNMRDLVREYAEMRAGT